MPLFLRNVEDMKLTLKRIFKGADWSTSPVRPHYELIPRYYGGHARANLPYVLNDHTATHDAGIQARFNEVKTWVCLDGATADAAIANPEADFFIFGSNFTPVESLTASVRRYFGEHSTDGIYTLARYYYDGLPAQYEQCGFTVEEIEEVRLNHMDANQIAYFIKLTYLEDIDEPA